MPIFHLPWFLTSPWLLVAGAPAGRAAYNADVHPPAASLPLMIFQVFTLPFSRRQLTLNSQRSRELLNNHPFSLVTSVSKWHCNAARGICSEQTLGGASLLQLQGKEAPGFDQSFLASNAVQKLSGLWKVHHHVKLELGDLAEYELPRCVLQIFFFVHFLNVTNGRVIAEKKNVMMKVPLEITIKRKGWSLQPCQIEVMK